MASEANASWPARRPTAQVKTIEPMPAPVPQSPETEAASRGGARSAGSVRVLAELPYEEPKRQPQEAGEAEDEEGRPPAGPANDLPTQNRREHRPDARTAREEGHGRRLPVGIVDERGEEQQRGDPPPSGPT